jgi:hypothetical protein
LAVLQTVASELLLLVQHEFDLLQPAAEAGGGGDQLGDLAAPGGESEGGGGGELLHPSALLTACQELLIARPESSDEEHEVLSQLAELLHELAPHLAHTSTLDTLGDALRHFLASVEKARGEELLRAEEVMLRAIARAAAKDADEGGEGA